MRLNFIHSLPRRFLLLMFNFCVDLQLLTASLWMSLRFYVRSFVCVDRLWMICFVFNHFASISFGQLSILSIRASSLVAFFVLWQFKICSSLPQFSFLLFSPPLMNWLLWPQLFLFDFRLGKLISKHSAGHTLSITHSHTFVLTLSAMVFYLISCFSCLPQLSPSIASVRLAVIYNQHLLLSSFALLSPSLNTFRSCLAALLSENAFNFYLKKICFWFPNMSGCNGW